MRAIPIGFNGDYLQFASGWIIIASGGGQDTLQQRILFQTDCPTWHTGVALKVQSVREYGRVWYEAVIGMLHLLA